MWSFRETGTAEALKRKLAEFQESPDGEIAAQDKKVAEGDSEQIRIAVALVNSELDAMKGNKFKVAEVQINGHAGADEHRVIQILIKPVAVHL